MIIGHAPAGYIAAKLLLQNFIRRGISPRKFLVVGILGALAPDLDMFYFYLIDHRQHHHHSYVSHFPILWLCLLVISLLWMRHNLSSKAASLAFIFCLSGFIHLILDSIVGDIWWFAPFIDRPFAMFTVPALYQPWWLNFIFHWSFALELALWVVALFIYRQRA
ncbi:MAG: metal-dependent hydrolase [Gallionella sp.]|nr:metal-dependent hydrolase [Gallionella sp.]MDD4960050.1 metal-dependent hydrolase [Gallionella sp.]